MNYQSIKSRDMYLYPIAIYSNIKKEIKINEQLTIREINDDDLVSMFSITKRRLGKNLEISQAQGLLEENEDFIHLGNYFYLYSSTHVLVSNYSRNEMTKIGKVLKLCFPGKTGILVGYGSGGRPNLFFHPNPYCQYSDFVTINISDLKNFAVKVNKFLSLNDKKLDLITEKYVVALSGEKISLESRFLELMIILEVLLVPEEGSELKFRASLRFAKISKKYLKLDSLDLYNKMNNNKTGYYAIRSKIVHEGGSRNLNQDKFRELAWHVRNLILLYLSDSSIFISENLSKICIK